MTAKRYQRKAINAWNRASEQRARESGQHMVTARIGEEAYRRIRELCATHNCSVRDVIEGFLFGTIKPAHPDGLSQSEIECARALGLNA